jgi:hypothetical protein
MSPGRPPEEPFVPEPYDPNVDIAVLRRRRERLLTVLALIVVVAGAGALAYYVARPIPVDERMVVQTAQEAVRELFGTGVVYVFGAQPQVDRLSEDRCMVSSEFLILNAAGASAHHWYDCEVRRAPDGHWQPAKLTLMPY